MDILKADGKRLQAFHMQCQCCIVGIQWLDFIRNSTVTDKTGLPDIRVVIQTEGWLSLSMSDVYTSARCPLSVC